MEYCTTVKMSEKWNITSLCRRFRTVLSAVMSMMNLSLNVRRYRWMSSVSRWVEHYLRQRDWLCVRMDMRQNFIRKLDMKMATQNRAAETFDLFTFC